MIERGSYGDDFTFIFFTFLVLSVYWLNASFFGSLWKEPHNLSSEILRLYDESDSSSRTDYFLRSCILILQLMLGMIMNRLIFWLVEKINENMHELGCFFDVIKWWDTGDIKYLNHTLGGHCNVNFLINCKDFVECLNNVIMLG